MLDVGEPRFRLDFSFLGLELKKEVRCWLFFPRTWPDPALPDLLVVTTLAVSLTTEALERRECGSGRGGGFFALRTLDW